MTRRAQLAQLTARWRRRHEARRASLAARPVAAPERQALAARAFPFRTTSAEAYVATHGHDMAGFTYDAECYDDPHLDAWIIEVGRLLRESRGR
ncbi:MAG TPA: hypothetical protein VLA76_02830 [Candidatus Angelobacter sp.]|nr:hypothetical protein [Candidatus Angelobacter sp.]